MREFASPSQNHVWEINLKLKVINLTINNLAETGLNALDEKKPKDVIVNLKLYEVNDEYEFKIEKTYEELKELINSGYSVDLGIDNKIIFYNSVIINDYIRFVCIFKNIIISLSLNSYDQIYIDINVVGTYIGFIDTYVTIDEELITPSALLFGIIAMLSNTPMNELNSIRINTERIRVNIPLQLLVITTTEDNYTNTIHWPSYIVWLNGTVPTFEPNKRYIFTFINDPNNLGKEDKLYCIDIKTCAAS